MTVKSKPKTRREKFIAWRKRRRYGVEMSKIDIKKFGNLTTVLKKDMETLGISRVSILINPGKTKYGAAVESQVLQIEGEGKRRFPVFVIFDYRGIQKLSVQELRSVAWHEFGHFIFGYYYPGISQNYTDRRKKDYKVEEAFADEFAYKKFGDAYIRSSKKHFESLGLYKVDQKFYMDNLKKMRKHVKQHGYGYWKVVAKENNIPVKYAPRSSILEGVKSKKHVLGNLR